MDLECGHDYLLRTVGSCKSKSIFSHDAMLSAHFPRCKLTLVSSMYNQKYLRPCPARGLKPPRNVYSYAHVKKSSLLQ
jgi:hypothetical protein